MLIQEVAIHAASVGAVGYPENPLKISWPGGVSPPNTDPLPKVSHSKRKSSPSADYHHNLIPENVGQVNSVHLHLFYNFEIEPIINLSFRVDYASDLLFCVQFINRYS